MTLSSVEWAARHAPFTGRELIHAIDKLPLRQQEIRDANRPLDGAGAQALPLR